MTFVFFFSFQIRVVNAFQDPAANPAQMPFRGRMSLASLASVQGIKSEASKPEPPIAEAKGESPSGGNPENSAEKGETSV